jgi:hypothetical protein
MSASVRATIEIRPRGHRLRAVGDHVDQDLRQLGGRHPHARQLAGPLVADRGADGNCQLLADRHGVAHDRQRIGGRDRAARIARTAQLAQA